jgi:hypothetical protein
LVFGDISLGTTIYATTTMWINDLHNMLPVHVSERPPTPVQFKNVNQLEKNGYVSEFMKSVPISTIPASTIPASTIPASTIPASTIPVPSNVLSDESKFEFNYNPGAFE